MDSTFHRGSLSVAYGKPFDSAGRSTLNLWRMLVESSDKATSPELPTLAAGPVWSSSGSARAIAPI